jgi:hypothetical protein
MEITSDNFEAYFPLIKESIQNAEFISIDSEFSGKEANSPIIRLFGNIG